MARLVFAVWGNETEVEAYREIVADYNEHSEVVDVHVEAWPDSSSMLTDIRSGEVTPDLYLLPRDELAETLEAERNRPAARPARRARRGLRRRVPARRALGVHGRRRPAVHALHQLADGHLLQHRPDRLRADGRARPAGAAGGPGVLDARACSAPPPRSPAGRARTPRASTSSRRCAAWRRSSTPAAATLFDDDDDPTSLALSDDDNVDALRQTLEVLRDPTITLTNRQLREQSALEYFEDGPARHDRRLPRPHAAACGRSPA